MASKKEIGPKIGIDGEAEYRKQMEKIVQETKTLRAEMTTLKTAVTDESNAQENARQKTENLNAQIRTQENAVKLLTEQLEKVKAATGETSTETLAYQELLAKAQTDLNNLKRVQAEATDEVTEFAQAEDQAGNSAITAGQLISANLISEAIISGLKKLVDLAKKAASAIYGCVTESAAFADEIQSLSTITGMSTAELQEWQYMSEIIDVSLDTVTGATTKLIRSMASARSGSESTTSAFQRLGVRWMDPSGTLRDSNVVFMEIIDALSRMEDGAERDALAMEIFGKSARELNPLIERGSSGIAALAAEAHEMGYVLDEETLERLGSLDDSLRRLDNLKIMIRNQLGAGMAPAVERIVDKLIELADRVDWEAVGEAIGNVLDSLADLIIAFADSGNMLTFLGNLNDFINGDLSFRELLLGRAAKPGQNDYVDAVMSAEEVTDLDSAKRAYAMLRALSEALLDSDMSAAEYNANAAALDRARQALMQGEFGDELFDWVDTDAFDELAASYAGTAAEMVENGGVWSADMMASYVQGIWDSLPDVEAAFDAVAQAGQDRIGHSEPKLGPMSDDSQWMPDLMRSLAAGISDNRYLVTDALSALAFDMRDVLDAPRSSSVSYGGVNVQIYGGDNASAEDLYNEFSYRMQHDVLSREAVYA